MQQESEQENKVKPPILVFTLMTLTNILINLDHGILPACTNEMKQHYHMNETQLGFLGSIVYLGIVIMGTIAGQLYQRINSKLLTLIALLCLEGSLVLFVLSDQKWMAYVFRFITGVCQVFLLVYYPIWIDKFGQHLKTTWLTLLQICVPVGIFAGYGITSGIIALGYEYQYSFYIQIVLVLLFVIAFSCIPKVKLDSRRSEEEDYAESFFHNVPNIKDSMMDSQIAGPHPQQTILQDQHKEKKKKFNYFKMMKKLLQSKMYLVGTLTMSIILFVSTGIQFWLTDYFINVLNFDRGTVNIAYAVISITGPTSGCGFGGFVLSKRGGYENPKSVYYVFLFACLGIGAACIIPFVEAFIPAVILLWIVLFFGGSMMPGLTGIMMASVPPYLRAFGNSNGQIIKNVLGYLPAPFMYGWFNSLFNEKAGIKLIMYWGLWAPILLSFGSFHTYKRLKKKSQIKEKLIAETEKEYSIDDESSDESPRKKITGINYQRKRNEQNGETSESQSEKKQEYKNQNQE